MKKFIVVNIIFVALFALLMACGSSAGSITSTQDPADNAVGKAPTGARAIPQELAEIPEEYYAPARQQGTLVDLYYDTYESFSYEQQSQPLEKHAVIYLPYGYEESQQYNVFYLMHGGWGNENQTLGTPDRPSMFKNVIDHAIEAGEFDPLIIVCPTYNNTSPEDSASFSLALQLNANLHNELLNDLLPAVEGTYSTYAADTTPEGLMAARDHRGFGGFSMGSVATWRTFQHGLDYFRYFLPMSCGTGLTDPEIYAAAENRQDFFVWVITGTEDFAYSYDTRRVENMRQLPGFTEGDTEAEGNFAYRVKEGYDHGGLSSMEYTYNGLRWFWNTEDEQQVGAYESYTADTPISTVTSDPVFGEYGRLIFPANTSYYSGSTLGTLGLTWYNNIDPNKTVEIVNYMKDHAEAGDTIFYDIYTDEEKAADPAKANTGLFFFKGNPGAKFAICNAGGGFAYVGAMHDSFPHALELSKMGYNAFALIYRPGWDTAPEDLARAISFVFEHADELEVDTGNYSLWGGSAGGRMVAYLGTHGPAYYGGDDLPRPGACIIQYTGHSEYSELDPPTYSCVGTNDGIASWRTMQSRLDAMSALGIPTEFHAYEGLPHGFGLGTGTVAEGWINDAVAFWEANAASAGGVETTGFVDVPSGAWYEEVVNWCYENGIISGTSGTTFSPNMTMNRGMLTTLLYRAEGSPEVAVAADFSDVTAGAYYSDAVAWAAEKGIVGGYGNGRFGPDDPVTREQIATILWRYAGSPKAGEVESFADASDIAGYAVDAVNWARVNDIISGVGNNRFAPKSNATRAQAATILYRYLVNEALAITDELTIVTPTPEVRQTIYLWDDDNIPAWRGKLNSSEADDFRPYIESYPAQGEIKGAVLICPGGAFQFRSMYPEGYMVAERLSALGYQCFVVSYRLSPYSQAESALDLQRAVRYVRYFAEDYGINPNDIAVVGFSAGGILCGEVVLNFKDTTSPTTLDRNYIPDALDMVSSDVAACGHIYSFYGRLSVSNNDVETLKRAIPSFYAYGTQDPFYNQFNQNVAAMQKTGIPVESHVYQGQPHGFGAGNENSNWIPDFDIWLENIFENF